jgi:hypothetical protein
MKPAEETLQNVLHKDFRFSSGWKLKNFLHGTWLGHPAACGLDRRSDWFLDCGRHLRCCSNPSLAAAPTVWPADSAVTIGLGALRHCNNRPDELAGDRSSSPANWISSRRAQHPECNFVRQLPHCSPAAFPLKLAAISRPGGVCRVHTCRLPGRQSRLRTENWGRPHLGQKVTRSGRVRCPPGKASRYEGTPIVLIRRGLQIYALAETCCSSWGSTR